MNVLLVGRGGREHALAWKLAQSPALTRLFAAPGNPGIGRHATCVPIPATAIDDLVRFAERERIDLTVVGPEAPLVAGIVDALEAKGLVAFGPSARAAAIEGSKAFAKDLMHRHGIPTAAFRVFEDAQAARAYCREVGAPLVVKADGLAAGKGAIVCGTLTEADDAIELCLERRAFGSAGSRIVVEEFLVGAEVSCFALSNGMDVLELGAAQDHKTVFDDDRGPNTGGMGAYAPPGFVDDSLARRVLETIVVPTIRALAQDGRPYRGVLYAGLMVTAQGPKVVEFNCRFGDPECQVLMTRLDGDLLPLLDAAARGRPLPSRVDCRGAAVCVVLASEGYPDDYRTGMSIEGVSEAERLEGVLVFHAGTAIRAGQLVTDGGRVLGVTAHRPDLSDAVASVYAGTHRIRFDGVHFRRDIGRRALGSIAGFERTER